MKIWTGKTCLVLALGLPLGFLGASLLISGCASEEKKPVPKQDTSNEVSLKDDRKAIEELRKDVPEEIKKSNDRLADTLARWKAQKMEPERLREKFNDEIRKIRNQLDKSQHGARDEFQRDLAAKRRDFLDKQKSERDSFYATKPKSDARTDFSSRQQSTRDQFYADQRDARSEMDDKLKDERKDFEDEIANRWVEFRQEFPEYSRLYKEMKTQEEKEREERLQNPKAAGGPWPYKFPGEENQPEAGQAASGGAATAGGGGTAGAPANPQNVDVNKGGNGWPTTDPNEFNQIPGNKSGH